MKRSQSSQNTCRMRTGTVSTTLNITVNDAHNHFDRATILLDVLARADAPFLEMRSDEEESYYRGTTGETRYEEGNWKRVLQFEVQAEEDRRIRLPSLRVRDLDAEANSETLEAAARGLRTAASAIRELVGGVQVPQAFENHKIEQDATLRLDISVEHGKISLCSIRCPGVLFVEAEHDRDASRRTGPATDGDVVRQRLARARRRRPRCDRRDPPVTGCGAGS